MHSIIQIMSCHSRSLCSYQNIKKKKKKIFVLDVGGPDDKIWGGINDTVVLGAWEQK